MITRYWTGTNGEYCYFWRNLGAPVNRLLRRDCARYVVIFRRTHDVTAPARVFNMLNICMCDVSSARRNRAHTAQPTQLVMDERICHRRFIVENYSRGKYTMGPLCNQASPIPHKWRICGYVRTSTQLRPLSERTHDFCDYAQATTLAVD